MRRARLVAGVVHATDNTTSAISATTTYTTPGPGPVVTVNAPSTAATSFLVTLTARITPGNTQANCFMSFDVLSSPGNTVVRAATDTALLDTTALSYFPGSNSAFVQASASYIVSVSGFTAYQFRAVYKVSASTCTFANRNIIVVRAS